MAKKKIEVELHTVKTEVQVMTEVFSEEYSDQHEYFKHHPKEFQYKVKLFRHAWANRE